MAQATTTTFVTDSDVSSQSYDFMNETTTSPSTNGVAARLLPEAVASGAATVWMGSQIMDLLVFSQVQAALPQGTAFEQTLSSTRQMSSIRTQTSRDILQHLSRREGNSGRAASSSELYGAIGRLLMTEDWAAIAEVSSFIARDVRLTMHASSADPTSAASGTLRVAVMLDAAEVQGYTARLYQHATKTGTSIHYTFEQEEFGHNPSFRACLDYDDQTYTAVARSKQLAKHLASKKAFENIRHE